MHINTFLYPYANKVSKTKNISHHWKAALCLCSLKVKHDLLPSAHSLASKMYPQLLAYFLLL